MIINTITGKHSADYKDFNHTRHCEERSDVTIPMASRQSGKDCHALLLVSLRVMLTMTAYKDFWKKINA